jgi:SAM-dependent methyltransferase
VATIDPLTDVVARQYERYPYPPPMDDVPSAIAGEEWFDPSHRYRTFWPDREHKPDLDILIAGCGTNQAAIFALANPAASVVGIDVSEASLNNERRLKDKHQLSNLQLHRLPIEEVSTLERDFDLIVSTGVLHHIADPLAGLTALGECLRSDGAMGVMLYAKYGRLGVDMVESIFQDLGLGQDEASIEAAGKIILSLPSNHLVHSHLKAAARSILPPQKEVSALFEAATWVTDTFLHGRQRTYTVEDCMDLVASAGLIFQGWLYNTPYYPHELFLPGNFLSSAVSSLSDEVKMWSVMERALAPASHWFISCRPDRPKQSYLIDFSTPEALEYIPQWHAGCGFSNNMIFQPTIQMNLPPHFCAFAEHVDGRRTIREISALVASTNELRANGLSADVTDAQRLGRELSKALWRLDFVLMAIQGDGTPPADPACVTPG